MSEDWTWVRKIKPGDVLENTKTGLLRVVRYVTHSERHTAVAFTIQHCSWTGRGYTIYFQHDLKRNFRPTKAKVRLNTKIDQMLKSDMANGRRKTLTCCMVKGNS